MNVAQDFDGPIDPQIEVLRKNFWELAQKSQGDTELLLSLLRTLELLHRQIREELFEPSLPNTRNTLYFLLKDIEENGGWPYIERMKLMDIINFLLESESKSF